MGRVEGAEDEELALFCVSYSDETQQIDEQQKLTRDRILKSR